MESDTRDARLFLIPAARDLYMRVLSGEETAPPASPECDQLLGAGLIAPDPERPGHMQPLDVDGAVQYWQASLIKMAGSFLAEAQSVPYQLTEMASAYRAARPESSRRTGIEFLSGLDVINDRLEALVNSCTRELLTAQPSGPRPADLLAVSYQRDLGVLKRGARMRTIYLPTVRSDGPTARWATTMTEQGAEIRTGRTFGRAIIVDRRAAVIPVLDPWTVQEVAIEKAVVVTSETLVAAVVGSFERDWAHSEAWDGAPEPELLAIHAGILACLARGMEQDGAAAELGVSRRTVTNRLAELKTMTRSETVAQLLYWWAKRELQR